MTQDPLIGRTLGGRFRLDNELGRGAMGVVYAGTQSSLARPVAIKILRRELTTDANMVARFRSEAEQAARLSHPNIVEIIDFGHEPDGILWIAMERLVEESLGTRLQRVRVLPERETVRIALEVLKALEVAHDHRIVHRDLKPDNVFLSVAKSGAEHAKLVDFGIAKLDDGEARARLTATGAVVGTPYYMSPEQARSSHVDGRTDLYALGAMMYEMLAGRPPLMADGYTALLIAILSEEPPPLPSLTPNVSAALARVIENAMRKDRNARFSSATEMARALSELDSPITQAGMGVYSATLQSAGYAAQVGTPLPASALASPVGARARSTLPIVVAAVIATAVLIGGAAALYVANFRSASNVPNPPARVATPSAPSSARPEPMAMPTSTSTPSVDPAKPLPARSARATDAPAPPVVDALQTRRGDHARRSAGSDGVDATTPRSTSLPPGGHAVDSIRYAGGELPNLDPGTASRAMNSVHWESCWPSGAPARIANTGRTFRVTVAPTGDISAVRADEDEPEEFMRCAARRIRNLNFGPTQDGQPAEVRVDLRVDPRW